MQIKVKLLSFFLSFFFKAPASHANSQVDAWAACLMFPKVALEIEEVELETDFERMFGRILQQSHQSIS